jgi:hypothetical protein
MVTHTTSAFRRQDFPPPGSPVKIILNVPETLFGGLKK